MGAGDVTQQLMKAWLCEEAAIAKDGDKTPSRSNYEYVTTMRQWIYSLSTYHRCTTSLEVLFPSCTF